MSCKEIWNSHHCSCIILSTNISEVAPARISVKASLTVAHLSGMLLKFRVDFASVSAGVNVTQVPWAPATALQLSVGWVAVIPVGLEHWQQSRADLTARICAALSRSNTSGLQEANPLHYYKTYLSWLFVLENTALNKQPCLPSWLSAVLFSLRCII